MLSHCYLIFLHFSVCIHPLCLFLHMDRKLFGARTFFYSVSVHHLPQRSPHSWLMFPGSVVIQTIIHNHTVLWTPLGPLSVALVGPWTSLLSDWKGKSKRWYLPNTTYFYYLCLKIQNQISLMGNCTDVWYTPCTFLPWLIQSFTIWY